jgi:hypothetical protein
MPVTLPGVQTISDVYSSGAWGSWTPLGEGFVEEIFRNATLISIYAYVTINNQGDPNDQSNAPPSVDLYDGIKKIGSIPPYGSMGFLLLIGAGQVLSLVQNLSVGQSTTVGTFVVAHVSIGPAKRDNEP